MLALVVACVLYCELQLLLFNVLLTLNRDFDLLGYIGYDMLDQSFKREHHMLKDNDKRNFGQKHLSVS